MSKDYHIDTEEIPQRQAESPAHQKRREVRTQLRCLAVDDIEELEEEEFDTYEPIKKVNKNGGRRK